MVGESKRKKRKYTTVSNGFGEVKGSICVFVYNFICLDWMLSENKTRGTLPPVWIFLTNPGASKAHCFALHRSLVGEFLNPPSFSLIYIMCFSLFYCSQILLFEFIFLSIFKVFSFDLLHLKFLLFRSQMFYVFVLFWERGLSGQGMVFCCFNLEFFFFWPIVWFLVVLILHLMLIFLCIAFHWWLNHLILYAIGVKMNLIFYQFEPVIILFSTREWKIHTS